MLHVTSWAMDMREATRTAPQETWGRLLLERLGLTLVNMWLGSCRVRCQGQDVLQSVWGSGHPVIAAIWHSSIIYTLYHFKAHQAVVMVSGSKDGEWVARVLKRWGQIPVRGSKLKGGLQAIRRMAALMREHGYNAGIVADGSQGPAMIAQKGPVVLARDTGAAVVPMGFAARPAHRFNSWDRTILPMPFSRVSIFYGDAIYVPKGARGAELEAYRVRLESALNEATARAEEALR